MAREFFKDLPDTTTPVEADRLNGLLDGEEAMGNILVDSVTSKNLLDPSYILGDVYEKEINSSPSLTLKYDGINKCLLLNGGSASESGEKEFVIEIYNSDFQDLYNFIQNNPGNYTISNNLGFQNYIVDMQFIRHENTFNSNNATIMQLLIKIPYAPPDGSFTYNNTQFKIQFEKGYEATDYVPFFAYQSSQDTGWRYPTSFVNNWFGTDPNNRFKIRRVGHIINISGCIVPVGASGTTDPGWKEILNLNYCEKPANAVYSVCQNNLTKKYIYKIQGGTLFVMSAEQYESTDEIPINMTYMA